jgi:hypothetical protein
MKLTLNALPFRTVWDDLGCFRPYGGRVLVVPVESPAASTKDGL